MTKQDDAQKKSQRLLLFWLGRRDYTRAACRLKLLKKGFTPSLIDELLNQAEELGWLNDERFTEHFIHYHANRGAGPYRIEQKLKLQGISSAKIAKYLDISDNSWLDLAAKVADRFMKRHHSQNMPVERIKLMRFLYQRGFTHEQITHAISTLCSNTHNTLIEHD